MKLNFNMDISNKSYSIQGTPSLPTQRLPFYIHGIGHMFAERSYFTDREGLDNYLLIYTISGKGYLKYKDTEYYLEPNQVVIFYCYEPQYYGTAPGETWEFMWAHINGASMKEYYQRINGDSINIVTMDQGFDISHKLDAIYEYSEKNDLLADVKICSALTGSLTDIIVCKNSELNNRNYWQHKTEIEKVVQFIQQNYNNNIGIDDIAEQILISKYHFLRIFKAYSGVSPYEYLINYRITNAKRLLKETEMSIYDISASVGYNDVNNFIRYFKKITGATPGNYRRYWIY